MLIGHAELGKLDIVVRSNTLHTRKGRGEGLNTLQFFIIGVQLIYITFICGLDFFEFCFLFFGKSFWYEFIPCILEKLSNGINAPLKQFSVVEFIQCATDNTSPCLCKIRCSYGLEGGIDIIHNRGCNLAEKEIRAFFCCTVSALCIRK